MTTLGLNMVSQPSVNHEKVGTVMEPSHHQQRNGGVGSSSRSETPTQSSSTSTTEDSGSAPLNRLSNMESSGNENNKRLMHSCASRHDRSNIDSAPLTSRAPNCMNKRGELQISDPTKPSVSSSLLRASKSRKDIGAPSADNDNVVIEERRRHLSNEGQYTVHKYLRGRLLGKGGFAKVYHCTAMDTNKNYAVKIVPKANLVKARARQKLQAEIKIHRTLKHRHVCEYKHFFEDRNNCYILLELCHNQSLNELIKRRKRLTEQEAVFFMKHMLEAVQYMHDKNVIHRDLKLGNLFIDKNMNIKVGDFGLATKLEHKGETRKTVCGTPNYIAPEVIQGDKATRCHSFEVDVWSMGVILYTTLFGKPPYEAKDVKATYQRIINNEYSFPRRIEVSDVAKDLIEWMLQSRPADRPSLDGIASHPFLSESNMPSFLPSSALHIAPVWTMNQNGEIVPEDGVPYGKGKRLGLPRLGPGRQPFAPRDNLIKTPTCQSKVEKTDVRQNVIKNTMTSSKSKPSKSSVGFQIYDESGGIALSKGQRQTKPRQYDTMEDILVCRTKSLSMTSSKPQPTEQNSHCSPNSSTSSIHATIETDAEVLQRMVGRLNTVLEITALRQGTYTRAPQPTSGRHEPSVWLTRYVDYTSKYGLGFLLNDGSSGVYFNDSTKAAIGPKGDVFEYIERKTSGKEGAPRVDSVETYSLSSYLPGLKKKVTLLKHFRNYLLDQQKSDGESTQLSHVEHDGAPTKVIYVKKWIRTKHAILFRLSNQTIQVIFYDQTEVILTPGGRYICYVDKNRERLTYNFTDELVGSSPEVEKRLKYTKEIMSQLALTSGQQHR